AHAQGEGDDGRRDEAASAQDRTGRDNEVGRNQSHGHTLRTSTQDSLLILAVPRRDWSAHTSPTKYGTCIRGERLPSAREVLDQLQHKRFNAPCLHLRHGTPFPHLEGELRQGVPREVGHTLPCGVEGIADPFLWPQGKQPDPGSRSLDPGGPSDAGNDAPLLVGDVMPPQKREVYSRR